MDTESSNVLHKNKRGQRVASESSSSKAEAASANAASANAASGSGKVDWSKVEELDVLLRPWLRIDGSLNRRVFDRLLGAVLGQGSTDDRQMVGWKWKKVYDLSVVSLVVALTKLNWCGLWTFRVKVVPKVCKKYLCGNLVS